ncbi:MAG: hypothetical protein H0T64_09410 [Pyrinomonadaceae bacterium]|nr:hypothetical protein [Pyrinomonadaceae bacterium]
MTPGDGLSRARHFFERRRERTLKPAAHVVRLPAQSVEAGQPRLATDAILLLSVDVYEKFITQNCPASRQP